MPGDQNVVLGDSSSVSDWLWVETLGLHLVGFSLLVGTIVRHVFYNNWDSHGWLSWWFSSVHFSLSVLSNSLQPHGLQDSRLPCLSPTPGVYPNSYPLSRWCHPTISSSLIPFFSRPQSFPASGSFQMSQVFVSDGQNIRVSALASVLSMNIEDWFPLGWTGSISLQPKGLWRVVSNATVQKHQYFGAQLSS